MKARIYTHLDLATDIMNQVNLTLTGLYENPMDLNNCCGTIDISRQILCFQDKLMAGWGLVILRQNRSMELEPTVVLRPSEKFSSSSKTSKRDFEPSELRARFLSSNFRAERVRTKFFRAARNYEQHPSERKHDFERNFW